MFQCNKLLLAVLVAAVLVSKVHGEADANETVELSFEDCVTTVSCFSSQSETGTCTVQYGLDPSYQDLGPAINSSLNSSFSLPGLQSSTLYYIQATFILDSELEPIIQRTNYTTGGADLFTSTVTALTAVGISVYLLAIVFFSVHTGCCYYFIRDEGSDKRCLNCKSFDLDRDDDDDDYCVNCLYSLFVIDLVVVIIPLLLWIVAFVYIGVPADTCAESWQFTRDALFISSCFFSLLSLVLAIVGFGLNFCCGLCHILNQIDDD